jgi:hypothetical protein
MRALRRPNWRCQICRTGGFLASLLSPSSTPDLFQSCFRRLLQSVLCCLVSWSAIWDRSTDREVSVKK